MGIPELMGWYLFLLVCFNDIIVAIQSFKVMCWWHLLVNVEINAPGEDAMDWPRIGNLVMLYAGMPAVK